MRVLVTGSTGFLGSAVVRALLREGHTPRALVRARSRLEGLTGLDVERVVGDVLDPGAVAAAMEGMEAVIHTAGAVGSGPAARDTNVLGTQHVLDGARARGLRVVHTSTIATIGATSEPVVLDERSTVSAPMTSFPYVESKLRGERLAMESAARGGQVVILNPGIILGPGDVYLTSTRIVSDYLGGALRMHPRGGISFCDVRDVALAHVAALRAGASGERHIVAGTNLTFADFFARLWQLSGLHRVWPMLWPMADGLALFSVAASNLGLDMLAGAVEAARYGQYFNFCDSTRAAHVLGYRSRDLTLTLADTTRDLLQRGVARPLTPRLQELLRS